MTKKWKDGDIAVGINGLYMREGERKLMQINFIRGEEAQIDFECGEEILTNTVNWWDLEFLLEPTEKEIERWHSLPKREAGGKPRETTPNKYL